MPSRVYSNAAVPTSLSAAVTAAATTITVASKTGYPTVFPFTITLEKNVQGQGEAVEVTGNGANAATDWVVTRGVDGTTALAHGAGALVSHDHTARDYTEWQHVRDLQIMQPGVACPGLRRSATTHMAAANTAYTVLTVPAGRKYVIKSIIANNHGGTNDALLQAYVPSTAYLLTAPGARVVQGTTEYFDMAIPLNAGESLQVQTGTAGTLNATAIYADLPAGDSPVRMVTNTGASPAIPANTWTVIYTAPSNMVVTSILWGNGTGSSVTAYFRVNALGGHVNYTFPSNTQQLIDTPFYLASGETLSIHSSSANAIAYTISGVPSV